MAAKSTTVDNPAQERSERGNSVWVDNLTVQNQGTDPLQGHMVRVVNGEHSGRFGVYRENAELGDNNRPKSIIVRTRDNAHELITVKYDDVESAPADSRR